MPKELSENDKYRNANYPNLYPCRDCYYWRGGDGNVKKLGCSNYMCHYCIENNRLRPCEPDLINQTCECFIPKTY